MTLSALGGETDVMELQRRYVCLLLPSHTNKWISLLSHFFLLIFFPPFSSSFFLHLPFFPPPTPSCFSSSSPFFSPFLSYPHPIFFTYFLYHSTLPFPPSSFLFSFFFLRDTTSFLLPSFLPPPRFFILPTFSSPSTIFSSLPPFILSFFSFFLSLLPPHVLTSLVLPSSHCSLFSFVPVWPSSSPLLRFHSTFSSFFLVHLSSSPRSLFILSCSHFCLSCFHMFLFLLMFSLLFFFYSFLHFTFYPFLLSFSTRLVISFFSSRFPLIISSPHWFLFHRPLPPSLPPLSLSPSDIV